MGSYVANQRAENLLRVVPRFVAPICSKISPDLGVVDALMPGTRPPLFCWQKDTSALLLANDEHLFYVLLARALALPHYSFPFWGQPPPPPPRAPALF